jgi:hypothetical protein
MARMRWPGPRIDVMILLLNKEVDRSIIEYDLDGNSFLFHIKIYFSNNKQESSRC